MAANLASVKTKFASNLIDLADRLMEISRECDELAAFYFANGFNTGATALVDGDLSAYPWLTAAFVTSGITTIQALSTAMTSGNRDNLRKIEGQP